MRNLLAGAVAAAIAASAALFGAGSANAVPDVVDRPYKDAKKIIQRSGGTPVIAAKFGNGADEANCLVTNAWDAGYPRVNSRGRIANNRDVLVALNCNGKLAAPGSAGNSALSPVGREAKAEQERKAARAAQ
ncbi:hypothetical protein [Mycobacterium sp. B14F4]|uniref:hypothetical protein n=1 Tax=Mycobacterium sp. B14F4 TaxID=3153565 RepID=UPI00325FC1DA